MKFRAAQQMIRDHEKLIADIETHKRERAEIARKAADAQTALDARLAEIKALGVDQKVVSDEIDALNRTLTEAHARRRSLQDQETKLCERVRDHAAERDRTNSVMLEAHEARGRALDESLKRSEQRVVAARARIARAEQKKNEPQPTNGEKIVKVVHVGIDGKPWGKGVTAQRLPIDVIRRNRLRPSGG